MSVTDVRDAYGKSPLNIALDCWIRGTIYVALYLVNHGCGSDEDKAQLLCYACRDSKLDVVKELVEQHKVNPNGEISRLNALV